MNIEDVKVGMMVVFTEDFCMWKVGDTLTVESIDRDGDIWTPEMCCTSPSRVRPATPEDISHRLWQSYKDILNDEALEALEQVIMGEHSEVLDFKDGAELIDAFCWDETPQGEDFWLTVDKGHYNKQVVPEVTKFDFTNTKINIKKYADENGITIKQAIKDCEQLTGKLLHPEVDVNRVEYMYYRPTTTNLVFLAWDSVIGEDHFNKSRNREITLTRNVTITPSFVIPDTITLPDGRTVLKKDYDKALSELKTFTGN